jgi:DNA-binding response OmpR family regulator
MIDSYIKQLRQKLEDDARRPALILTVHGLGYKLDGGTQ